MKVDIEQIILDPQGFVIFNFRDFDTRAAFIRQCVPAGDVFAKMRFNDIYPFRVSWKLDELSAISVLPPKPDDNVYDPDRSLVCGKDALWRRATREQWENAPLQNEPRGYLADPH